MRVLLLVTPEFGGLGRRIGPRDRGSNRTAPGPQGAAGRRPRPLPPLDEGPAARLLSGGGRLPLPMASPPAPASRGHPADPALFTGRLRALATIGPLGWGWTPHRPPGCPRACGEGEAGASPPAQAPALGRLKSLGRFVPGGSPQPLGNLAGARCASGACAAPAAWPAAKRRLIVWRTRGTVNVAP